MLIGIITLAGAAVSALIGAGFTNTDLGKRMDEALEGAKDSILGMAREVKQIVGKR